MSRVWGLVLPVDSGPTVGVPTGGLRGDELMEELVPTAARLVGAVHELDPREVSAIFSEAGRLAGDRLAAAEHLAVLLAGMAPEEHAPSALLGWTLNPDEYHRLKPDVDVMTASIRAGRT